MQNEKITHEEVRERLQVVVVGGDILAYSYVRELHRAYGIENTIVLATKDVKMLSSSRFSDYRISPNIHSKQGLYDALKGVAESEHAKNPATVLLVLGCDDCHARMLSSLKPELEQLGFVVPYIDFALLDDITQKKRFYEICDELEIPYPKTWYFNCESGSEEIDASQFTFPLIAKPSNSAQFQDAAETIEGWRKIYEIETPEELQRAWQSIRKSSYNNTLVVQEFIPGGDDAIFTLTTFSNSDGQLKAVSGGQVCLQDHDPTALGNPLCILGVQKNEIIEAAKRFLLHTKYCGFANFDIKYDARSGRYCFFEVNTRAGRNTYYMSLGGKNFCELIIEHFVLQKPIEEVYAYKPFVYCCVPPYVLKRSIPNAQLLQEIMGVMHKTEQPYPLHYSADTFMHNIWATIMYVNQIRKFKRFYWDTGGKQLK